MPMLWPGWSFCHSCFRRTQIPTATSFLTLPSDACEPSTDLIVRGRVAVSCQSIETLEQAESALEARGYGRTYVSPRDDTTARPVLSAGAYSRISSASMVLLKSALLLDPASLRGAKVAIARRRNNITPTIMDSQKRVYVRLVRSDGTIDTRTHTPPCDKNK